MPMKIVYGVQGSLTSSAVRDHGVQHSHYPEEVLNTHHAIGQAAASCHLHFTEMPALTSASGIV